VPGKGWGIALLLAAALAGCGSSGGNAAELTSGQRQALVAQLEAVRAAAGAHDVAGAQTALGRFKASVARLRRSGALSDDTARLLRIGAARVVARVKSDNPPPAPTQTTPAPAPQPAPKPPGKHKGEHHPKPEKKHHGKPGHDGEGGD
jgi:hypothetical protein